MMDQKLFEEKKEKIYGLLCDRNYVPMKLKEMAALLAIPKERRDELRGVLDALIAEGKASLLADGTYQKGENPYVTGVFTAHARGFGFVAANGGEEDIFIPESGVNHAIHEDLVQVSLVSSDGRRREGRIAKILAHGLTEVVGTYEDNRTYGFVRPDNPRICMDIFVPAEHAKGAATGQKVVAELVSYGSDGKKPEGRIKEILGYCKDPGVDILSIVRAYGFPTEFPERVLNQAVRVAKEVSPADREGRLDLRSWQTVTIDGEDARDLDDAVTLKKGDGCYYLGVHIADVTNYVQEGSALDKEAFRRGTSVYLVDRVIPMLPPRLSNGICSLNQGEDRLALSCIMKVDEKGAIVDHQIAKTVICVDRRMSYTDVNRIITDRDEETMRAYEPLVLMFLQMKELADLLRKRRRLRGSIDFDFPETKVVLDEKGRPVMVRPYERNAATRLIEDFMLAANETVAQDFFWQELPFVYRTHDAPEEDKIRKLSTFINNFGYHIRMGAGELHPKELQKLLLKIEGTPEEDLIARLTLRSMKQARYTVECTGHFGLAARYYCHFTSPIRRYPDLQIHRIIKDNLCGRMNASRIGHYQEILPKVAQQSSRTERRADEAERETVRLKKAEYMQERIGEVYTGVISGITAYGLYVELPDTVEGMVHISTLPGDYFNYVESTCEMVGEHTGRTYRLGQTVRVRVTGTNLVLRTVDFELAGEGE